MLHCGALPLLLAQPRLAAARQGACWRATPAMPSPGAGCCQGHYWRAKYVGNRWQLLGNFLDYHWYSSWIIPNHSESLWKSFPTFSTSKWSFKSQFLVCHGNFNMSQVTKLVNHPKLRCRLLNPGGDPMILLPSGKRWHNYEKNTMCLMAKSTISMIMFNSYVSLPEGNTSESCGKNICLSWGKSCLRGYHEHLEQWCLIMSHMHLQAFTRFSLTIGYGVWLKAFTWSQWWHDSGL